MLPVRGSTRGLAISCGLNPRYGGLDPYAMAGCVIDEAIRNAVAVGADPERIALLDNFCWGNPERPETLGSLVLAAQGCHDLALSYGTPFISGKDSLYNEYAHEGRSLAIPPTLLISAIGQVPDVRRCVTMDLKEAGNLLLVVGETRQELGGSAWSAVKGAKGGRVPRVDPTVGKATFRAVHEAISRGLIRSCHDLSEGGLAVALAEMAIAGGLGASVSLRDVPCPDDAAHDAVLLFSESPSRFVIEVRPGDLAALFEVFGTLPIGRLGEVTAEPRLSIAGIGGGPAVDVPTSAISGRPGRGRSAEGGNRRLPSVGIADARPTRRNPINSVVWNLPILKNTSQMQRFVTFVDGSNLDGVLKHLNLRVDDYGSFYRHVFEQSVQYWGRTFAEGSPWPAAQHARIYWYVVGKMDEWDLSDPKAEARLRSRFELNPRLRDSYMEEVGRRKPDLPMGDQLLEEAWHLCFAETREWYDGKRRALERKKRFYHGVQAATDFVEIRQEGHWKVDLLHHTLNEKGLDTGLAVDMVALVETYDVALLISGDADGIPGINYVKGRSKHVGVIEFRRGAQADFPTKGASSRLKIAADFVVQIYEADLLRRNLAYRSESDFGPAPSYPPSEGGSF